MLNYVTAYIYILLDKIGGDFMALDVSDILKRPFFKKSKILAGAKGLKRKVEWVHIVEIAKFGHLLNGKEIILTTGLGWADDEDKSLSYLQQLLDYGASALCIELVIHVKNLPQKMLELADQHNFPIIGFTEEVRFIDITKDIHELIIGHHEHIWWRLEKLHKQLNNKLISNRNIGDFLKVLHKETEKQIALKYDDQYRFFPSPSKKKQYKWINYLEKNNKQSYYSQPISLLDQHIAHLYLIEEKNKVTQFDKLALKRGGEILNQYFWKHHHQKESQQMEKNEWIINAIAGLLNHEEIVSTLQQKAPGIILKEAIVAVKPIQHTLLTKDQNNISETAIFMLLRPILYKHGFQLFTVTDHTRNIYILLLINQQSNDCFRRLEIVLDNVYKNNNDPLIHHELQWISFGRKVSNYEHIAQSYETALSTLHYQQNIERLDRPFYKNLAIYRIIDQMNSKEDLQEIILDYLQPLIKYDEENGTELIKTLQIYFKNLGAINETAKELYIVRQTLYHRLNRIKSLLKDDFTHPQNRLMIEFSIYALKYVSLK